MNARWFGTDKAVHALTRAVNAALTLAIGALLWLLGSLYLAGKAADETELSLKANRKSLAEHQTTIAKAEHVAESSTPAGMAAISYFQSALVQAASKHGCVVNEFTARLHLPEPLPEGDE
jgi:hypothetical protein